MRLRPKGQTGIGQSFCAIAVALTCVHHGACRPSSRPNSDWRHPKGTTIELPAAKKTGGRPLNEVLQSRRSRRAFSAKELTDQQIAQLCWAAQGITDASGKRTAPSAGGLNPITIVVAGRNGVHEYLPQSHELISRGETDLRRELQAAALGQSPVGDAPACFIVAIDVQKTAKKYGSRAERYCLLEAGHVAQNILLTAEAYNLAAVPIGALSERRVSKILGLPSRLEAVYLVPVGIPQ